MKKDTLLFIVASLFLAGILILSLNKMRPKADELSGDNQLDLLSDLDQTENENLNQINQDDQEQSVLGVKQEEDQSMPATLSANQALSKPEMIIDANKTYLVTLNTDQGEIVIELDTQNTPITSNNFVYLAEQGFYNGTIFHRVIDGFMIQGGDPRGDGSGGPGYHINDEKIVGEYTSGVVAMANQNRPNSAGSQFFIVHQDTPFLPKNYVIFGQVVKGIEVVDAIATAQVEMSLAGERSRPVEPVVIKSAVIQTK